MVSPYGVTCRVLIGSRFGLVAGLFEEREAGDRLADVCWAAAGRDAGSARTRHNARPTDFRLTDLLNDDDQSNIRFSILQGLRPHTNDLAVGYDDRLCVSGCESVRG